MMQYSVNSVKHKVAMHSHINITEYKIDDFYEIFLVQFKKLKLYVLRRLKYEIDIHKIMYKVLKLWPSFMHFNSTCGLHFALCNL